VRDATAGELLLPGIQKKTAEVLVEWATVGQKARGQQYVSDKPVSK